MQLSRSSVDDCRIITLPKIHNDAGNITVVENGELPFVVKRVYYLYDVPSGEERGGHAHFNLEQYVIAASGSFDVVLSDALNERKVFLNRPDLALHIVPGIWRELENFSSGSICLVLASSVYAESDYIRDLRLYQELKFKSYTKLT